MGDEMGKAMCRGVVDSARMSIEVLILLGLAWRFLRHPDDNATTGRIVIGGSALLVGIIGLWHLEEGGATPSDGAEAMANGGGGVGWRPTAPVV